MAAAVKFQLAMGDLLNPIPGLNLNTDTLKLALTNTSPNVSAWHYYSSVTGELSTSNGYTLGGASLTAPSVTNASGVWSVNGTAASPTWTSVTGNMGPFEWIILYDNTPAANKTLFLYWDYGSALTLNGANGDTFTVSFSTANVPFTLS